MVAAVVAIAILLGSLKGYSIWFRGESIYTPGPDPFSYFNILGGLMSLSSTLICLFLSLILFKQRRHEPMALFVSFYVMVYGIVFSGPLENLDQLIPGALSLAMNVIQPIVIGVPTLWLIVLLPDGRPVPSWTRWLFPISLASMLFLLLSDINSVHKFNTLPVQLMGATWLVLYGLAFGGQIYRYRRISTPEQREQTRWVVFGLVAWMILVILISGPYIYLQNLAPGSSEPGWTAASNSLWWLTVAIIPVTLTIATLRYRLYDIDLIINRALVYGALTAILAGLYPASISLFQKVFIAITGEKSDAAIVLTTLILASTFTPIKMRLQSIVDRRFIDVHEPLRQLSNFSKQVESGIWVIDRKSVLKQLLNRSAAAFGAVAGVVIWFDGDEEKPLIVHGDWNGEWQITVPLVKNGRLFGKISLGPRKNRASYSVEDTRSLTSAADAVADALTSLERE